MRRSKQGAAFRESRSALHEDNQVGHLPELLGVEHLEDATTLPGFLELVGGLAPGREELHILRPAGEGKLGRFRDMDLFERRRIELGGDIQVLPLEETARLLDHLLLDKLLLDSDNKVPGVPCLIENLVGLLEFAHHHAEVLLRVGERVLLALDSQVLRLDDLVLLFEGRPEIGHDPLVLANLVLEVCNHVLEKFDPDGRLLHPALQVRDVAFVILELILDGGDIVHEKGFLRLIVLRLGDQSGDGHLLAPNLAEFCLHLVDRVGDLVDIAVQLFLLLLAEDVLLAEVRELGVFLGDAVVHEADDRKENDDESESHIGFPASGSGSGFHVRFRFLHGCVVHSVVPTFRCYG